MPTINDETLHQFDALNNWLNDVYDKETNFSTILAESGFTEEKINHIKQVHLSTFLHMAVNLMTDYTIDIRSEKCMMKHYGLINGKPESLETIGHSFGVCRERIWQLLNKQMTFYRIPEQQVKFQRDFVAIGRELLDGREDRT